MKPLIVLLSVFAASLFTIKISSGDYQFASSGRIAISAMLLFTAVGHFAFTEGMTMMLPPSIPFKTHVIVLTGIFEIAAAVAILVPGIRLLTGWLLIVFLILILPANIYAAMKHIDYQVANYEGKGLQYLWFRVPLQILFIVWTYFSCIRT